jgi:hypothetical protein
VDCLNSFHRDSHNVRRFVDAETHKRLGARFITPTTFKEFFVYPAISVIREQATHKEVDCRVQKTAGCSTATR